LLAGKQHWLFPRNRAFPYSAVFSICASFWACRILPQINAPRNPQVQTDPLADFQPNPTRHSAINHKIMDESLFSRFENFVPLFP
jgi:hypothetical protein